MVFPHLAGWVPGFGTKPETFAQWQQPHVIDTEQRCEWDFQIYSIVDFFNLAMKGTPNILDALFTPERCVLVSSPAARLARDNRKLFLSKRIWATFRGYAYQQVRGIKNNQNTTGKRKELVEKYGYDTKHAGHVVRLLDEVQQLLQTGDMSIDANREQLKSVRQGAWTLQQFEDYFNSKERELESVFLECQLPNKPDEDRVKDVLLECLRLEYGSLEGTIAVPSHAEQKLQEIRHILDRV